MLSSRPAVYAGLTYVVAVWALNTVAVKYAFREVDPLAFTGLRFAVMAPLAFVFARITGNRIAVNPRDLPLLIACGACGYGIYQYLWVLGLAHTTAFASALLGSFTPVITLAFVAVAGIERVHGGRWLGAIVALFGIAVFEGAFAGHATFRIGDALTLGGSTLFALFNVLSARLLARYTPLGLVVISLSIGTLMILPGALMHVIHQPWERVPAIDWVIFAFSVFFPILLTYPVWNNGLSRLGAGRTSLFQFAVPVLAGLLSVLLLRNRIEPHQIAGGLICILGMAGSQIFGRYSLTQLWAERTLPFKR